MGRVEENQEKNRLHYEKLYSNYSIKNILFWVRDIDSFLNSAISTQTSWCGLYQEDLRYNLKGKKVLEMGCGDCVNAAVMAALGAEVYANDIARASGNIVDEINENCSFDHPIVFVEGDFLQNNLPSNGFDLIVGKAFLHHLTIPVEKLFISEAARLLKPDGEARFFEPAVNSKILDAIRWYIPVKGRPSKFNNKKFKIWKENDPHPDRTFSSKHWEKVGKVYFKKVKIIPVGTLERFNRLIKKKEINVLFRKWALKNEKKIPLLLNVACARSQVIIYRKPKEIP